MTSTRWMVQDACREARGSWASRRGEMALYNVKGRSWRISISGRSFMRVSGGILGRSQEGIRVLETPSGREELEASIMVNQHVGDACARVDCMRQRARLCRAMYEDLRVGWQQEPSQWPHVSRGGGPGERCVHMVWRGRIRWQ